MARIFTEGAEFGDKLFFDYAHDQWSVNSTTKRSGTYSYYMPNHWDAYKYIADVSEFHYRCAFRLASTGCEFKTTVKKGSTTIGYVVFDTSALKMKIYVGGSAVATGTAVLQKDTWYLLEWHLKIANSGGISEIKIDGVPDASYSGDTQPGGDTTVDKIQWNGTDYEGYYIDDLALNDTSGASDNNWCGDGRVELLKPNGNGSLNQWTGSDGNSTDNYALVDEIPPSSTDYVEDSTSGNKDKYTLEDFTGTGKLILRIWAEGRAMDTVPEGAQMKIGIRTNSTDYVSDAITLTASYAPIKGSQYAVNPADSGAWEDADLDGLELVLETV